jgi:hypothetical protein
VRIRRQQGFVLASTVWLIAVLLLLGAVFHNYVQSQVEQAIQIQEQNYTELDLHSTSVTVRYMLLTRHITNAGLSAAPRDLITLVNAQGFPRREPFGDELRLDGTTYAGIGCARIRLQDRSGLVALNAEKTDRFLAEELSWRLSEPMLRTLSATLADYRDFDSERRISGAEAGDYRQSRMPLPRNHFLRSDREIDAVMGWPDWLAESSSRRAWFDIGYSGAFNVNTAPGDLLALLLEIGPDEATKLVRRRELEPFASLDEVLAFLNRLSRPDEERFRFRAGDEFRLELWCHNDNRIRVRGLQLTPQGLDGPAQTDYSYRALRNAGEDYIEEDVPRAGALFPSSLPAGAG